ncbi:FecR domain-containing protein [Porticoccaceae bacterium LTM1]|nr:FecR domain-containing protein [Porticoccaceae bacterium LTM1]
MTKNLSRIAESRAALNTARLFSGLLSPQEAKEINGWQQTDPEYKAEYLSNMHLLADMEALRNDGEVLDWADQTTSNNKQHWLSALKVASIAAIAVLATLFFPQVNEDASEDINRYVSRVGEIKTVSLDDGSTITLNSGAQVLVTMTDTERKVTLERGEAFFDVTKEQSRPFNVLAGQREVTVLGTSFSVHKQPNLIRVAVVNGAVCVHKEEDEVFSDALAISSLTAESQAIDEVDQFRIEAGWVADIATAEHKLKGYTLSGSNISLTWMNGYLEFSRLPLYKVIQELNRYSGKKILIEDPNILGLEVSAIIRVEQIGQALSDLEDVMPIEVTSHFDRVVIVGKE